MSKKVAILATHGFEESELKSPKENLATFSVYIKGSRRVSSSTIIFL